MICAKCGKDKNGVRKHRPDVEGAVCDPCYKNYRFEFEPGFRDADNACRRERYAQNPGPAKARSLAWQKNNPRKVNVKNAKWAAEHSESEKLRHAKYNAEHREEQREKQKTKLATDPVFKIARNQRTRLAHFLRGRTKSVSAVRDAGCSSEYLKLHLEEMFYPNATTGEAMDWSNYGVGHGKWNIDHIVPLATIKDLTDREKLLKIIHYTNLQPLWFEDNMAKSDKLNWVRDAN